MSQVALEQSSPFATPRTRAKPAKYSDAQFIVNYSDAQFIVKYSDAQFIAKYSDAQFIVKYSDAQSIAKYSDTHFVIVIRIRICMFITTTSTKHIQMNLKQEWPATTVLKIKKI